MGRPDHEQPNHAHAQPRDVAGMSLPDHEQPNHAHAQPRDIAGMGQPDHEQPNHAHAQPRDVAGMGRPDHEQPNHAHAQPHGVAGMGRPGHEQPNHAHVQSRGVAGTGQPGHEQPNHAHVQPRGVVGMGRPGYEQSNHVHAQPHGVAGMGRRTYEQPNHPHAQPHGVAVMGRPDHEHANYPHAQPHGYLNNQVPVQRNIPTTIGIPVNNQTQNLWSSELFDCMNDSENAMITCIFPCVTFGQITEIVDEGATPCVSSALLYGVIYILGLPFVYSHMIRTKLRNKFGLPEAPAPDWTTRLFCEHCALCQEYRELKHRGFYPDIGWIGNVQAQQQQEMMAPPTGQTMMG